MSLCLLMISEQRDDVGGRCWGCMLKWSLVNDTGSLWTTECHDTAFFILHRERTQAHTPSHTVALRPWKCADMSGSTRRRSVCGAAEQFSCDNAGNDTPHPRVTRGQSRAYKQWFMDVRRIGKYN